MEERRNILKKILAFLAATSFVAFFYPLVKFLTPPDSKSQSSKVVIKKSDIPPGTAKEVIFNDIPAIIINRKGKGFIAFSRVCTHMGCLVGYNRIDNELVCPCHAGVFNLQGNVLSGPAPRPLTQLALKITADKVTLG